jgi:hypothetical protein
MNIRRWTLSYDVITLHSGLTQNTERSLSIPFLTNLALWYRYWGNDDVGIDENQPYIREFKGQKNS